MAGELHPTEREEAAARKTEKIEPVPSTPFSSSQPQPFPYPPTTIGKTHHLYARQQQCSSREKHNQTKQQKGNRKSQSLRLGKKANKKNGKKKKTTRKRTFSIHSVIKKSLWSCVMCSCTPPFGRRAALVFRLPLTFEINAKPAMEKKRRRAIKVKKGERKNWSKKTRARCVRIHKRASDDHLRCGVYRRQTHQRATCPQAWISFPRHIRDALLSLIQFHDDTVCPRSYLIAGSNLTSQFDLSFFSFSRLFFSFSSIALLFYFVVVTRGEENQR